MFKSRAGFLDLETDFLAISFSASCQTGLEDSKVRKGLGEEAPTVLGLSPPPTGKIAQDGSTHLDVDSHLGCLSRGIEPGGLQGENKTPKA